MLQKHPSTGVLHKAPVETLSTPESHLVSSVMGNRVSPEQKVERIFKEAVDNSQYEPFKNVDLNIENLVFEGCGAKSIVYIGVVKVTETIE